MKSKMYRLHCPSSSQHHQVRSALQQLPTTTMAAASTTANIKHFELKIMTNMKPGHNGESVLDASAQPSTPLVISPPLQTYAESVGHHNAPGCFFTCFVVLLEVAVFVALVLVAMALYETLSIPSTIDFDVRLGNIVAIAAVTYPVFAYAARSATLSVHRARSVAQCLGAEAAAVLATLVYCGIQSLPAFVLQIALKDTSLGESASTIGMIVTVLLGMTISNIVPRIRRAKLISGRKIPEEYAAFL